MSFSRVGTGRGPLKHTGTLGTNRLREGSSDSQSARSQPSSTRADGPATTVYTQAIGAANALRRKQRRSLRAFHSNATERDLERVIARNARQVGLGLRSGMWLPTNAIAKTASSIDNQVREHTKRGKRRQRRHSRSTSPSEILEPIAAEVAADGAVRAIEAHLAANAAHEQEYLDACNVHKEQLQRLTLSSDTDLVVTGRDQQNHTLSTQVLESETTNADDEHDAAMPYRLQSSQRLNTDAALAARKQLRYEPLVSVAIDRIWLLATGYGRSLELDKQTFVNLNILVQKALDLDRAFDVFEAENSAITEWETDTVSSPEPGDDASKERTVGAEKQMSHQQFHDSLFELVDIWTSEISAQAYAAFLWQLLQRISHVSVVFDDSVLDGLRTRKLFSHDRAGASAWEKVRREHKGQEFAARYSLKSLDDVLPWTEQPTTSMYTHPHLFREVEDQTQLLRAELMEDDKYLHGTEVDTSKEIMRNSSHSFSGLVSGTAVGWPFDGSQNRRARSTERKQIIEVVTGRRVLNSFRHKKRKKTELHNRRGFSNRRMASPCSCQRCQAACMMQRCWRGLIDRRLAFRVRAERHAACIIQNCARTWLRRRISAATQMQCAWRGCKPHLRLHSSENHVLATVVPPANDQVAHVCDAHEMPEQGLEPPKLSDPHNSSLTPDHGLGRRGAVDDGFVDRLDLRDQLFLNGASIAVRRAAVPLQFELSAEVLHREREMARKQKAGTVPVHLLRLADGVREQPLHRFGSSQAQATERTEQGLFFSGTAGHEWVPSRTSLQRSTTDPQVLSNQLLQRRLSCGTQVAPTAVRRTHERIRREISHRPTSAPCSHHLSSFMAKRPCE